MSFNVNIKVEDDWEKARPVTTIESGDSFQFPVTLALLFSKVPDGTGCSVAVASDKDTDWTSQELMLAVSAFVKDFVDNTDTYGEAGPRG